MWWFLVLLGLLIALAGLAVIALGVSIFVSTFGNTLITTGAVAASGGFVIMAMGLVLRQLERLSTRLDAALGRVNHLAGTLPAERVRDEVSPTASTPTPSAPTSIDFPTAPRRDDQAAQQGQKSALGEPEETATTPAIEPPRRREGLRATAADSLEVPALETAPLPPPLRSEPALRAERSPPRAERNQWAEREAPEAAANETPQRSPRALEPPPLRLSTETARDEQEEPRILKSGIVGGMAYTLYSDGSIQAELPDGIVRFDSLHELRDHVARTQGR